MPRVLGIDLPKEKRIEAALPYIYGIGPALARKILTDAGIDFNKRAKDLSEEEVSKITSILQKEYRTEGDLRREVTQNIKRLIDIGSHRGYRHKRGLPVRGQRTRTNARTRKGKRRMVGAIVKVAAPAAKPAKAA
ncbi:MAG TPA: 30S ribosomal protein S13 [Candidatus Omnitrophota bacterium]|nr:30S ribosomal protein S13 [Candidatus Omnitrophota bacterium]HPD83942.1 30S ribosomal protein S13 [Candidatus Omnitrophota bacterium]HRZ02799.1 30S ribosomal protein S13 [Candidatus Omnitrophota bacterium]